MNTTVISYNPITIYTLYEITNQMKKILNTYSEDVTQIKLYGEYIYLNNILNKTFLETKEQYEEFKQQIKRRVLSQYKSKTCDKIQTIIQYFYKNLHKIIVPNFDSCRWNIDFSKFKKCNLIHIHCLYLNKIENIPNGVNTFIVSNSFLKKIDNIPSSLKKFICNDNQIVKLPPIQHCELTLLNISNNQLHSLPLLPNTLEIIYMNNNAITNIPNFPKSLKHLECSWNKIYQFDNVSKNIHTMILDHNEIVKLPKLSDLYFLKILKCNSNHITEMPPLSNNIEYIEYSNNPLEIFVPFPFSIIE